MNRRGSATMLPVRQPHAGSTAAPTRVVHVLSLLGVTAVPAAGWFFADWSGPTTLAVYWFETLAACLFIIARIAVHQRWSPRRGHFSYNAPSAGRRGVQTSKFITGFAVTSLVFCAAHGLFLGAIVFVLHHNGNSAAIDVNWRSVGFSWRSVGFSWRSVGFSWRSVGFGCLSVLLFLALDFVMDLLTLRRWSFLDIEQTTQRALSRVVVIHLTLIFGFLGLALTDAPGALFGVFVVLKSMSALSVALPQWEPAEPPKWLSRIMNRVPNVHPGKRFEEFWSTDRANETARRERNELPWRGR